MSDKQAIRRLTLSLGVAAVFFFVSLAAGGDSTLRISPNPVEYKRGVTVTIAGEGFRPKQEIGLLIMLGGVLSDVRFLTKPRPIADEDGKFKSEWKLNNEIRRKLLLPGSHTVEAVDEEGKTLAKAKMVLKKK